MAEITLTGENFEREVMGADIPVLIDFWASWCGPCMMLSPIIEKIADENSGRIKVCKVNVDEQEELSASFGITSIPALFVIKNGKVTSSAVGYMPEEKILDLLK